MQPSRRRPMPLADGCEPSFALVVAEDRLAPGNQFTGAVCETNRASMGLGSCLHHHPASHKMESGAAERLEQILVRLNHLTR